MKIIMLDDVRYGMDVMQNRMAYVVDDDLGRMLCVAGFAVDDSGEIETGQAKLNVTLEMHDCETKPEGGL